MDDKEVKQATQIPWTVSSSGISEVYANMIHVTWSLDDVRVRLAQLVPGDTNRNPGPDFTAVAEERAAATLTWRSAKILRDQLSGVIESYENSNGPIKVDVKLPIAPTD